MNQPFVDAPHKSAWPQAFALHGLNALVIGGSSGIGRALALGLQEAGARVAIAGRTAEKVEAVTRALRDRDASALGFTADVSSDAALETLLNDALAQLGHIDILVPCQGITILKPAEEFTLADYELIMAVNIRSVFFTCIKVGRHMLARGSGSIINIGSMASHRGFPRAAVYAVSKHGVIGLTKTLAAEWAARGVRVNAISPGFFPTELSRKAMSQERRDSALRRTPMGRFGELEELVGTAVYLASPASAFVTGVVINVDGGYLASGI
ncbi:MAG TPA: SDR family oxidoreductase [Xanthobacteraceae bacterium]|nr:SDR family oxidoreductase [Xanthobacteraceae bacterium]